MLSCSGPSINRADRAFLYPFLIGLLSCPSVTCLVREVDVCLLSRLFAHPIVETMARLVSL